jgi:chromosome partition protein MukE
MTDRRGYAELQDVVMDPGFPELDLALRRGRHIDRDDFAGYTLLTDAQAHLEAFYRRYGCELVHKSEGYFYLLPSGDMLSRRQLGPGDMLVGQALALLYLDPSTIERGGRVTAEDVVAQLVVVLGSDALIRAFNPKLKRKYDERIAQKNVRTHVGAAVRHLATLGFVDLGDEGNLKLRPALMRFAEPVRGLSAPAEALAKLVALGEVALVDEGADPASSDDEDESHADHDVDSEDGDADSDDGRADPEVRHAASPSSAEDAEDLAALAEADELEAAELASHGAPDAVDGTLPLGDLLALPERPTAARPAALDADDDDPPYTFESDDDEDDDEDVP